MKKIIFVISMLLTTGFLGACSSDENNQPFRVRNFSNSGCKPATRVGEEGEILPNNEAIVVKDMKDATFDQADAEEYTRFSHTVTGTL